MTVKPFIVIEDAESAGDGVPVDVAREQMRASVGQFIEQALQFHAKAAPDPGVIDLNPPPHEALKITTGAGKSEGMRQGAADFVLEQKRRQHERSRVMFGVPTHRLAEEASNKLLKLFGARGVSAAIYQSRDAKDLQTGEPLCRNLEAVKAAQTLGLDVQKTCCKSRKKKCRFFHGCAFQLQRENAEKADVVFAAHELMFTTLNRFGEDTFGLVIIDEGFVQKGLLHDPRQTRIKIGDLDADLDRYPVRDRHGLLVDDTERLREITQKLQAALMKMPDGRLTRQPLADEYLKGLKHSPFGYRLFSDAGKLEYRRMPDDVDLQPDTSAEERRRLVEEHKYRRQILRRARMWKELDRFLNGEDEIAGRLILETVKEGTTETRYLRVLGKKEIHSTVTELPILHGDATLEIDLVRHHLPRIQPC
jgi:hypothetical protein